MAVTTKAPMKSKRQPWNWLKVRTLVLLLLEAQPGSANKPLTVREISVLTGCELKSLKASVGRWNRWGYLQRHGELTASYSLTPLGYGRLQAYKSGWFKFRRGQKAKFYIIDVNKIMLELIARNPERYSPYLRSLVSMQRGEEPI